MNHIRNLFIRSLTLVLFTGLFFGCTEKSGQVLLEPPADNETDSTCTWLGVNENFHSENYYPTFRKHYTQLIQQKSYAHAADLMCTVADREMYFLSFDSAFSAEIQKFDTLFADRLPWNKTLFVSEHKGYRYMDQSEFRKAISEFRVATSYQPFDYGTHIDLANMLNDLAFCYSAIGEQEMALRHNHKALTYFEKVNSDASGKGSTYDNIALVHLFTKNYSEAEIYFDKAIEAYTESGDTGNIFITQHNRILLYLETNDPRFSKLVDSTYHSFKQTGIKDPSLEVALSNFYMDELLKQNRMDEAKLIIDNMRVLAEDANSSSTDDDYLISLAQYQIHAKKGIFDRALLEKALAISEEGEHYQNQYAFCEILKKDAILRGDFKRALEYSEKEKSAVNNLADRDMRVKTIELNKRHETEKKEQRIALQSETILNKNITIALLVLVLGIFVLGATLVYYRHQQKKNRLENQRAAQFTRQLLEKTEEERKRIAGDLHDSVSHELLILKNAIHEKQSNSEERIDSIIHDIRIISRNLHPVMFEKVGLAASVEQLAERTQSTHDLMVTTDIEYKTGSLPSADELQIYRIVQEALSNTIKYADAYAAKITLSSKNDSLYIEIKDNGKGFDVDEKINGQTAFGLHNILERSKAIGGTAKIQSDKSGTIIIIEIKKTL